MSLRVATDGAATPRRERARGVPDVIAHRQRRRSNLLREWEQCLCGNDQRQWSCSGSERFRACGGLLRETGSLQVPAHPCNDMKERTAGNPALQGRARVTKPAVRAAGPHLPRPPFPPDGGRGDVCYREGH